MMHRARSSIVEVPYCFSRSSVKFQGHTALKVVEFDPKWAFPDCNSSLNSPMAMKCCIKLETAKERCPIVFQGHQSNFKVTWYKTSPIFTQIGRFQTIGQSQLSNPSDLSCYSWNQFYLIYFWFHFYFHDGLDVVHISLTFNSSLLAQNGRHFGTIFSNAFSWIKSFVIWLKFYLSLFLRVQLTITQHWFR